MEHQQKHILVIRLSAMGDVAMTVPVLRALSQAYPKLKITVLSRAFFKPLFEEIPNLTFVAAEVEGKHKGFLGLLTLAKEISTLHIDVVADLHNVIRSKIITQFFKFSRVSTATIDKGRKEKKALTHAKGKDLKPLKTTHQRYAEVFEKLGFNVIDTLDNAQENIFLEKKPLSTNLKAFIKNSEKKLIGIAPFAAYQSKMYPLQLMEEVIDILSNSGDYQILLLGGVGEKTELDAIKASRKGVINISGRFSFEEELALISNLHLMVAMDSGNGHLAAMYGVPVITLWGVTHPAAGFAPFGQPKENQITSDRVQFPLIPTSIYGNKYPEGYKNVMDSINPLEVVKKIKNLL